MTKARTREKHEPKFKYVTSLIEAKYMIKMNQDRDKFNSLRQQVADNMGYCPVKERSPENRCICKQFIDRDSEGYCKFRLYYKEARTEKAAESYLTAVPKFNEKKEKEIEKEVDKEEKAAEKALSEED